MTIIIGVVENGAAWIASDSAVSLGDQVLTSLHPKYFEIPIGKQKRPLLIGVAGNLRIAQLIEGVEMPHEGDEPRQFALKLAEAIRGHIRERGAAVDEQGEQYGDFQMLAIWEGRIFAIYGDFSVLEPDTKIVAIGSGQTAARGALYALRDTDLDTRERITEALGAAAHCDTHCAAPYYIHTVRYKA